jgi:hypothetical protein
MLKSREYSVLSDWETHIHRRSIPKDVKLFIGSSFSDLCFMSLRLIVSFVDTMQWISLMSLDSGNVLTPPSPMGPFTKSRDHCHHIVRPQCPDFCRHHLVWPSYSYNQTRLTSLHRMLLQPFVSAPVYQLYHSDCL